MSAARIRVQLPEHLRRLARVDGEVVLDGLGGVDEAGVDEGGLDDGGPDAPVTLGAVLDALEARHPVLRGTVRDHDTHRRRPFVRFFACREDLSHLGPDAPLPADVAAGREPLRVVGAMAGG